MKRILLGLSLLLCSVLPSFADSLVVAVCGTLPLAYSPGATRFDTVDVNGNKCISGTISASFAGFTPATTGTPISVTTGGVSGTLPSGAVVVASNVGATNNAYCKLGASATTSDQLISPNSWFAFTVGAATQLTCITSTSTTTVNMVGGSGFPSGAGGGGGSGGGAVTIVDGGSVTLGAKADAACGTSTGTCTEIALLKYLASVGLPVTNTNPNGPTTASGGSPTVPPTDYVSGKAISALVKGTTASMTGTSSTQLLAAVSSKVIYAMNLDCVNSSTSVDTLVTLQDGSGGTTLGTVAAAHNDGGHALHATFPITWTTSGNGLYVANATTGAAVICTASGFAQ